MIAYSIRFTQEATHSDKILPRFIDEPWGPGTSEGQVIFEWEFINTSGIISQIREADACLLLANKYCQDPDAEDAGEKTLLTFIRS